MLQERERGGTVRGESKAVSVDDRPYGRCYGQVCGQSYPCTQRAPKEERKTAPSKEEYQRAKRGPHGSRRVRCPELGATFASMADAAKFAGVSKSTFQKSLRGRDTAHIKGHTFEVMD